MSESTLASSWFISCFLVFRPVFCKSTAFWEMQRYIKHKTKCHTGLKRGSEAHVSGGTCMCLTCEGKRLQRHYWLNSGLTLKQTYSAVPYLLFCTVPVWPEFKIVKSVYVHKSLSKKLSWRRCTQGGGTSVQTLLFRSRSYVCFSDAALGVNSSFQIDGMHQNKDHFEL